jgi:hypothetical protein
MVDNRDGTQVDDDTGNLLSNINPTFLDID